MGEKKKATYEIKISHNAKIHLNDIENYIAVVKQQPINAIKVIDAILAKLDSISLNPLSFKECALLKTKSQKYRQVKCLSWTIYYSVSKSNLQATILGIILQAKSDAAIKELKKVN